MKKQKIRTLAVIALMTAVICVMAPFSLPIGPVPVSLATFAVMLAAVILGWKWGTASVGLYLLLGLIGVPVFSGFSAGASRLIGPTGGYLIGYLPLAFVSGLFAERYHRHIVACAAGMLLGTLILYGLGTGWLALQMKMSFGQALAAGVIPFIPGDLVKIAVTAWIAPILHKTLLRSGVL